MAAAISAADTSLTFVIRFLHLDKKSQQCWLLYGSGEEIDRLKEHFLTRYQHRARSTFKNQFKFLNRFLIEKMASDPHVLDGSGSFIVLPGVSLG
jgi:hypothetical protein